MNEGTFDRWDTPISNAKSVSLISLHQTYRQLTIVVGAQFDKERVRVRFEFEEVFGYRSLLEEYQLERWKTRTRASWPGWTGKSSSSVWLQKLRSEEALFVINGGEQAIHYEVDTDDDVIDIIAGGVPMAVIMSGED